MAKLTQTKAFKKLLEIGSDRGYVTTDEVDRLDVGLTGKGGQNLVHTVVLAVYDDDNAAIGPFGRQLLVTFDATVDEDESITG